MEIQLHFGAQIVRIFRLVSCKVFFQIFLFICDKIPWHHYLHACELHANKFKCLTVLTALTLYFCQSFCKCFEKLSLVLIVTKTVFNISATMKIIVIKVKSMCPFSKMSYVKRKIKRKNINIKVLGKNCPDCNKWRGKIMKQDVNESLQRFFKKEIM